MSHLYVLEIPDLQFVLNQEDIAVWELYLVNEEKRYEKLHFHVTDEEDCYTFCNVEASDGQLAMVRINFYDNTIVFEQAGPYSSEFEDYLTEKLAQLFVRIRKDRIQFLATRPENRVERLNTRR